MSTAASEITLDPTSHVYSRGLVTYTSVSAVIKSVMPTDYSAIPEDVLANARDRGIWIDAMLTSWLRNEQPVISKEFASEHPDWVSRLQMLIEWWKKQNFTVRGTQVTVSDEVNLIAGTLDLDCDIILDLKIVSELQPSYFLQLGAYLEMMDGTAAGIIHVTKDRVRLVEYHAQQCRSDWNAALSWYLTKKRLEKKQDSR